MQAQDQQFTDTSGITVTERFFTFLHDFQILENSNEADPPGVTQTQQLLSNYNEQIINMIKNDKTTVYINFEHLMDFDSELGEAIELEYYRFESFLRKAVQDYVSLEHRDYVHDVDKGTREFFVSIYNMPRMEKIRSLKTDRIGRLIAVSGTVTRSSEVRPELLLGSFACDKCATVHAGVEQQCTYTLPQVCRNPECPSASSVSTFDCLSEQSVFVDWQRLRVQENADEIPPGSMPRCIDVILRNEIVESAKAGDKVRHSFSHIYSLITSLSHFLTRFVLLCLCLSLTLSLCLSLPQVVFTGTLLVVPDVIGGSRIGENTTSGRSATSRGSNDGFNSGVTVSGLYTVLYCSKLYTLLYCMELY